MEENDDGEGRRKRRMEEKDEEGENGDWKKIMMGVGEYEEWKKMMMKEKTENGRK